MPNATPTEIGAVVSLWRYPVKSMLGEELHTAHALDYGLLGDRVYALIAPMGRSPRPRTPEKGRASSRAGHLHRATRQPRDGASAPHDAARWHHRDQCARRLQPGPLEGAQS
jgi:uncharacterized protein YcbX